MRDTSFKYCCDFTVKQPFNKVMINLFQDYAESTAYSAGSSISQTRRWLGGGGATPGFGGKTFYYRPQTKFGQGNIFAPVCHSVHRRGVPGPRSGGGAWSRRGAWSRVGGCLVPGGGCLVPGGGCLVWRGSAPGGDAWWRPPGTATASGGTHPTGMHSCLINFCRKVHEKERN